MPRPDASLTAVLRFRKDLSAPDVALDDWWCPDSMAYGFQGFSYPLEVDDCGDYTNSVESMSNDFARMKADFGATIVRMYYPTCTQTTVFRNALLAAIANDMAVVFQVWTNFGSGVRHLAVLPSGRSRGRPRRRNDSR